MSDKLVDVNNEPIAVGDEIILLGPDTENRNSFRCGFNRIGMEPYVGKIYKVTKDMIRGDVFNIPQRNGISWSWPCERTEKKGADVVPMEEFMSVF